MRIYKKHNWNPNHITTSKEKRYEVQKQLRFLYPCAWLRITSKPNIRINENSAMQKRLAVPIFSLFINQRKRGAEKWTF